MTNIRTEAIYNQNNDISGNLKFSLPQFFSDQPEIAFGINDLAGGSAKFRSKYVSVSQSIGLLRGTVGKASGQAYLNGFFAGAELAVFNSGMSILAERNGHTNSAGLRYASPPIAGLANASVVLTAQRAFGAQPAGAGGIDRSSVGVSLVIPFGANARNVKTPRVSGRARSDESARARTALPESDDAPLRSAPADQREEGINSAAVPPGTSRRAALPSATHVAAPIIALPPAPAPLVGLRELQAALEKAGLERVRVGTAGDKVVVEYENHRYNRNEVDAIGIALGLATKLAPESADSISVITKKAGLALYETRVDRQGYRRFLSNNNPWAVRQVLWFALRPQSDASVQWLDAAEGRRGYSHILVEPVLKKFVATEFGVLDYSLAADVQAIVPLWKGAEFKASYIENLANSDNVRDGGVFAYARQESGQKSVTLNQSFWVMDRLLNVTSLGKFEYNYTGIQNETTLFVPGRDDQVRFQYTRIQHTEPNLYSRLVSMGAFYRWNYQPLDLRVEAGYSQYTDNDRGPSLSVGRWFGDILARVYLRRSDAATFAGFQLMFPLTPRQGMRPGFAHVEGPGEYALGLETRLARSGGCNCIVPGVGEEIPIAYSADKFLSNHGRLGKDYLISQLPRMREAFLMFGARE